MLHKCYSEKKENRMDSNTLNDEKLLNLLFNINWSDSKDNLENSDH